MLDLILGAGLAHPDVNVPIFLAGRRVVPDFRWAREPLVVEADGAAWHEHKLAREDDAERQALLPPRSPSVDFDRIGRRSRRSAWRVSG